MIAFAPDGDDFVKAVDDGIAEFFACMLAKEKHGSFGNVVTVAEGIVIADAEEDVADKASIKPMKVTARARDTELNCTKSKSFAERNDIIICNNGLIG